MKKIGFVILFCTLVLSIQVYGLWVGNEGIPPITQDGKSGVLIINGASDFLLSYSQILLLLNESEVSLKSEFDLIRSKSILDSAIKNLIASKEKYFQVVTLIKGVSFKADSIEKLRSFDFDKYAIEKNLHRDVMNRVSFFLKDGDIVGLYTQIVNDLEDICNTANLIQKYINSSVPPNLDDLRLLFQKYSDFMLFGYYSSRVFLEIKN